MYVQVHQLECKYHELYTPIYSKRTTITTGDHEPTDAESEWPSDSEDEEEENLDDEPVSSSGSKPIARITPSNPKIQINETISFSGSDSTDSDNDALTYQWSFEDDSKQLKTIVSQFLGATPGE